MPASPSMSAKLVAEFTGTFLLMATIGCNVLSKNATWAGVSIACALMVSIYAFGGISGANFNPAVSFTLGITKVLGGNGMPWKDVGIYSAVQIAGAICAGFFYFVLFGSAFTLGPAKGFGLPAAVICELLYTLMLCFVVLNVAVAKKTQPNEYYGLAIGFVIVAGAYGAGAISGGCFNPAVAIAIDISSAHMEFVGACFLYTCFQLGGAALAAGLFMLVRPEEFEEDLVSGHICGTMLSKLASEFVGTYFLVLTIGLNILGNSPAGAFSIAAALMCMIYALGDVSGAHFNPAVTLAIFCSKLDPSLSPTDVGLYMITQIIGGIAGAFTYVGIYGGRSFTIGPGTGYGWPEAALAEILFTFVLCIVVLGAAVSPKTKTSSMFGLAIGSCITVGGFAVGGISGASLNPAVSIGIASSHIVNGGLFYKGLMYSSFEFIGAAAAAGVAIVTHVDGATDKEKDVES